MIRSEMFKNFIAKKAKEGRLRKLARILSKRLSRKVTTKRDVLLAAMKEDEATQREKLV